MSTPPNTPHASEPAEGLPSLSWTSFNLCLAIVLVIFFALNPLWQPIDMTAMDRNIGWSYAPIPLLVLVFLRIERKLGLGSFAIETLRLTFVKFVVTFLFANILWALTDPPPAAPPPPDPAAELAASLPHVPHQPPTDSPVDAALGAGVSGVVLDPDGLPAPGALVWVSDDLAPARYAPPTDVLEMRDDGHGLHPDRLVIRAFQTVTLHSDDGALHALSATDATGRRVANVPLSPSAGRELVFERAWGLLTLACEVHRDSEPVAHALVVSHPFAALTDSQGRFAFEGVPSGARVLSAWTPAGGTLEQQVTVPPGATLSVRLGGD